MALRLVTVILNKEQKPTLLQILKDFSNLHRYWVDTNERVDELSVSILINADYTQGLLEKIQNVIPRKDLYQMLVVAVEAAIPKLEEPGKKEEKPKVTKSIAYDEIYLSVANQARLTPNFILLVIFSTIVAVIGILGNELPTLIGAMLIAPLLGPNLALALGTVLCDTKLMRRAIRTNVVGVIVCLIFSYLTGVVLDYFSVIQFSGYLVIHLSYSSIVLAIASGAAAALYLVEGAPGSLVGIMIATALLPPTTVTGIAISIGHYHDALSSFLLLIINIVCISLSANVIFLMKGIKPYEWHKKRQAMKVNVSFMSILIVFLLVLIGSVYILLKL